MILDKLIENIIQLEYKMFDQVHNVNGRASCQDDYRTFSIMRESQFSVWDEATLKSYFEDLAAANSAGINLMTEKYGYMMMDTDPEGFLEICDMLKPISKEKMDLVNPIIQIHHQWLIEFFGNYPYLASNGRAISQNEVKFAGDTSALTYLKGELLTYSIPTLQSYRRMINTYVESNRNMHTEIIKATALHYGYASLEAAENALSSNSTH